MGEVLNQNVVGVIKYAIGILQMLGIGASVIVLAIIGVKWFLGNPQEKANIKSKITTYALGMFILICGPLLVYIAVTTIVILTGDPGTVYVATGVDDSSGGGSLTPTPTPTEPTIPEYNSEIEDDADSYVEPDDNDEPDVINAKDMSYADYIISSTTEPDDDSDIEEISAINLNGKPNYTFQLLKSKKYADAPSYTIDPPAKSTVSPNQHLNVKITTAPSSDIDFISFGWSKKKMKTYYGQKEGYIVAPAKAGDYTLRIKIKDTDGYYTGGTKKANTEKLKYEVKGTLYPPTFTISPDSGNIEPGQHLQVVITTSGKEGSKDKKVDFIKWQWDDGNGNWGKVKKCSGKSSGYITAPSKDGTYKLRIAVRNKAKYYQNGQKKLSWVVMTYTVGNQVVEPPTVPTEPTEPTISISPSANSAIAPSSTITATLIPDTGTSIDFMKYYWNDGAVTTVENSEKVIIDGPSEGGTHILKIAVRDSNGYYSNGSKEEYFANYSYMVLNNTEWSTPPMYSIAPATGSKIEIGQALDLKITTDKDTMVDYVAYKWDNDSEVRINEVSELTINTPTALGSHTLRLSIKDKHGKFTNGGTEPYYEELTYTVKESNVTAPSVALLPGDGSTVDSGQKINVTINVASDTEYEFIKWKWDNGDEIVFNNNGTLRDYIRAFSYSEEATHILKVAVKDKNGYYTNGEKEEYWETYNYTVRKNIRQQAIVDLLYEMFNSGNITYGKTDLKYKNGIYQGKADCSGLVKFVYKTAINKKISGTPNKIAANSEGNLEVVATRARDSYDKVEDAIKDMKEMFKRGDIQAGDILCYGSSVKDVYHTDIYLGGAVVNGKTIPHGYIMNITSIQYSKRSGLTQHGGLIFVDSLVNSRYGKSAAFFCAMRAK